MVMILDGYISFLDDHVLNGYIFFQINSHDWIDSYISF